PGLLDGAEDLRIFLPLFW
ncbi:hypothetical protein CISIN_1g0167862mg, partial [Citrus sinensis]